MWGHNASSAIVPMAASVPAAGVSAPRLTSGLTVVAVTCSTQAHRRIACCATTKQHARVTASATRLVRATAIAIMSVPTVVRALPICTTIRHARSAAELAHATATEPACHNRPICHAFAMWAGKDSTVPYVLPTTTDRPVAFSVWPTPRATPMAFATTWTVPVSAITASMARLVEPVCLDFILHRPMPLLTRRWSGAHAVCRVMPRLPAMETGFATPLDNVRALAISPDHNAVCVPPIFTARNATCIATHPQHVRTKARVIRFRVCATARRLMQAQHATPVKSPTTTTTRRACFATVERVPVTEYVIV